MDLVGWRAGCVRRASSPISRRSRAARASTTCASCRCRRSRATWSSTAATRLAWYDGPTLLQILETAEVPQRARPRAVPLSGSVRRPADGDDCRAATWDASNRARSRSAIASPRCRRASTTTVREIRTFDGTPPRAGLHASVTLRSRRRARHLARRHAGGRRRRAAGARAARSTRPSAGSATRRSIRGAPICCGTRRAKSARASCASTICGTSSTQAREPAPAKLARNDIGDVTLTLARAGVRRSLRRQPRDGQLHPDRRRHERNRRRRVDPLTSRLRSPPSSCSDPRTARRTIRAAACPAGRADSMPLPLFRLPPGAQRDWLAKALARPAPASARNLSDGFRLPGREGTPRPAAVLVPLVNRPEGLQVLLTQRSADLPDHPGQISFPGGRVEPDDASLAARGAARSDRGSGAARRSRVDTRPARRLRNGDRLSRDAGRRLGRAAVRRSRRTRSRWPTCSKCRSPSCSIPRTSSGTSGCSVRCAATSGRFPTAIATSGARPRRCC